MANVENLMPSKRWDVFDASEVDSLVGLMEQYGTSAEKTINDVIHEEGAQEIKKRITSLLPSSGRHWKGKGASARSAMPKRFSQDDDMLTVTIAARGKYHYLYFPDDGSNTKRHAGNQRFMLRGAENAVPRIVEMCLGKLISN